MVDLLTLITVDGAQKSYDWSLHDFIRHKNNILGRIEVLSIFIIS